MYLAGIISFLCGILYQFAYDLRLFHKVCLRVFDIRQKGRNYERLCGVILNLSPSESDS